MSFTNRPLPRSLLALAGARGVSLVGDEVALIAWLFRAKGSFGHWGVVAVLVAGAVPLVAFSPWAGLLVDRVRTRPLLLVATLTQGLVALALAFSGRADFVELIAALACATCVAGPGWQVLVPTLVSDEQMPRAMATMQSATAMAGMLGPFIGGLAYGSIGFRGVLLVDAASYGVLCLIPIFLRADREPTRTARDLAAARDSLWSGVTYVVHHPMLRTLVVLLTFFVLTLGVVNVVEIFFATTVLHVGARGYGLLGLSFGLGMLMASAAAPRVTARAQRAEVVFAAACVALSACLGVFAVTATLAEAAGALFCLGAANALVNVEASVLLVRATIPVQHVRGRVFSAITGIVSAAQILSLALGGVLLTSFAPRTIVIVGAVAGLATLAVTIRPLLSLSGPIEAEASPTSTATSPSPVP